jgi:hypothetical protein
MRGANPFLCILATIILRRNVSGASQALPSNQRLAHSEMGHVADECGIFRKAADKNDCYLSGFP